MNLRSYLRPFLRRAVAAVAVASLPLSAFAAADANSFALVNHAGRNIGKASYTITKTKDGYKVTTHFQYRAGISGDATVAADDPTKTTANSGATVTDYQYSGEYKIADDGSFLSGFTQNSANQILSSFQPNKTRSLVTVGQIQGGVNLGSRDIELPKPWFLLAPDYDPSAIQLLLTAAAAHPHSDSTYLFLVPASGSGPKALNTPLFVTLQPLSDTPAGTLDGKPVTLKHIQMNYHAGKADLYVDDAGNLMQADMGTLSASYIRTKFVLTPATQ